MLRGEAAINVERHTRAIAGIQDAASGSPVLPAGSRPTRKLTRRRRLTLAPATMHALRRSQAQDEEEVTEKEEENRRAEGREALSRAVAMAVELSHRPHPVHGDRIKSKFWATADESDQDDRSDPSTPEFIQEAVDAGFTCDQLAKAEHVLHSGKTPSSDDLRLPKTIIAGMLHRKFVGEAWQGPLPEPRVSPPRTLGDLIEKAIQRDIGLRGGSRSIRSPRPPSGSVPAKPEKFSNSFESPEEIPDPVFPPLPRSATKVAATAFPAKAECARPRVGKEADQWGNGLDDQVLIGPGKFFRPTKGLCALFSRTGTKRVAKVAKKKKTAPPRSTKPSYAEVVREGKNGRVWGC